MDNNSFLAGEQIRNSADKKEQLLEQMSELQSNLDSESAASRAFGLRKQGTIRSTKGNAEQASSDVRNTAVNRAKNTYEMARKSLTQSRSSMGTNSHRTISERNSQEPPYTSARKETGR